MIQAEAASKRVEWKEELVQKQEEALRKEATELATRRSEVDAGSSCFEQALMSDGQADNLIEAIHNLRSIRQ